MALRIRELGPEKLSRADLLVVRRAIRELKKVMK